MCGLPPLSVLDTVNNCPQDLKFLFAYPKMFLLENVQNLVTHNKGKTMNIKSIVLGEITKQVEASIPDMPNLKIQWSLM